MRLKLVVLLVFAATFGFPAALIASPSRAGAPSDRLQARVAYMQANTLYLAHLDGAARQALLTGNDKIGNLAWYSWSPDGKYLLVVRARASASGWDMVLFNADGKRLRTLATAVAADFYPSWASDGDQVAFIARTTRGQPGFNVVASVDMRGQQHFLWRYRSMAGCGGGNTDPAQTAYWKEIGFGDMSPTIQWSINRHLVFHGGEMIDTRTGKTLKLGTAHQQLDQAMLSSTGRLAATLHTCTGMSCNAHVVLLDPVSGRILRTLARGEFPTWSPDGLSLYFVQRTAGRMLHFKDALGNPIESTVYTSSIWQSNANGTALRKLLTDRAYGFGRMTVMRDGQTLIFSRVANASALWRHRLPGNQYTDRLLHLYGPTVRIERLDAGITRSTVVSNAGQPAVQV